MNTRKDNNGKALKAWVNMSVGHIAKPLKHIINRDSWKDAKGNIILGEDAKEAFRQSKSGNGLFVQKMALSMK